MIVDLFPPDGDPSWDEDADSCIGTVVGGFTTVRESPEFGFGALVTNHAEPGSFPGEHHCWLYHSAYDHSGLGWRDLLRVGSVWVDLVTTEQTVFPVAAHAAAPRLAPIS